ncbi:uncharacterized protein LOC105181765 [Harpegnathos saltator]|uniref:uncharacterized protein LOC105181765 n=1 Tax=Harpegnathos saltator TaxID=610380 RepID=UPI000DBEEF25|nr:uncharacterized protein LOC105181765 [Harpegnathos saltator]
MGMRYRGAPPETQVLVDGVRIHVEPTIKYLGLTLDSRWDLGVHFKEVAPRVRRAGLKVTSLMCAQGGPKLEGSPPIRGCGALDGPLWGTHLGAPTHGHQPRVTHSLLESAEAPRGGELTARGLKALKSQARAWLLGKWSDMLSDPREFGLRTAEAVRPCLPEMVGRVGCGLTFHLVQVLTGHRGFSRYLHRISKESITRCHHCPELENTVENTLTECQPWALQRHVLARAVGCREREHSLPRMVKAMCGSEETWVAAASFCEDVMLLCFPNIKTQKLGKLSFSDFSVCIRRI